MPAVQVSPVVAPNRRRDVIVQIEPRAVDVRTMAAMTGIGVSTIREQINAGLLPARLVGRRQIITVADVDSWLDRLPKVVS